MADINTKTEAAAELRDRLAIGSNHPPENEKIEMLVPASELETQHKAAIKDLTVRAKEIVATYGRIPAEITDDAMHAKVITVVAAIRKIDADRERQRKAAKDPYLKATTQIDSMFKLSDNKELFAKKMELAVSDLSRRLSVYDTKKYQEQQKAQAEQMAKLAEAAAQDGITLEGEAAEVGMNSVKSEHGGLGVRQVVKTWQVSDEEKIPRSLLSIDPKKIQKMIDDGAKEIPGIIITEVVQTHVRRS